MDKDQSFDKLLSQTMSTGPRRDASGPCLDAETLAAWVAESLSPAQRASAEMHLAECDRCLAVVAAIAKTDPLPLVPASGRWFSVRWLVPVATAAVAVAAWVLVQPPQRPPAAERGVSTAPSAPAPAPPAAVDALHDQAPASDSFRKDASADRPAAKTAAPATTPRVSAASPPVPAAAPVSPSLARSETAESRAFAAAQKKDERSLIRSPDSAVQWRIDGPLVERSVDNGGTWRAQATGTAVDLLAGASPSAAVCWIVGRNGTVLLTTDGASWRVIPFPDAGIDLVAVTARSAAEATVTTTSGRAYRTVDGGKTWTLQENPAAPF